MYLVNVMSNARRVREPVQVYLDPDDKTLLEEVARKTGLSQAEVLRRGVRRLSADLLAESRPGASLDTLIGALGTDPSVPADLAARHDDYLYGNLEDDAGRG
jgi:hypothetical protein